MRLHHEICACLAPFTLTTETSVSSEPKQATFSAKYMILMVPTRTHIRGLVIWY